MKKERSSSKIRVAISMAALGMIAFMAVLNVRIAFRAAGRWGTGTISFQQMTNEIQEGYRSDELRGKYESITVNGLFARLSQRRVWNNVVLMRNGMLTGDATTEERKKINNKMAEDRLTDLAAFLDQEQIGFLYIQAPSKNVLEELLPAGLQTNSKERAGKLVKALQEKNIHTVDLIPIVANNSEDIEKYFYRTDHHWNSDGALKAFPAILDGIEMAVGKKLNKENGDQSRWNRYEKENWWLGSRGKRVGPLFAGMDSLIWHTPLFETSLSAVIPFKNRWDSGDYMDVCIRKTVTEKTILYQTDSDSVYFGGNEKLIQIRNAGAANQMKVLLMGDSFSKPLKAFLAVTFSEVDVIDPRYYDASSIAQYIAWNKPEVVVLMAIPGQISNSSFMVDFGGEKQLQWAEEHKEQEELLREETISMTAEKKGTKSVRLDVPVKAGEVYHVDIADVMVTEGKEEAFTVMLCQDGEEQVIQSSIFDIAYYREKGGFHWAFQAPDNASGPYEIRIRPGILGKNKKSSLQCFDLSISRETTSP